MPDEVKKKVANTSDFACGPLCYIIRVRLVFLKVYYDMKFIINFLGRAFKVMKNFTYFI